MPEAMQQASDRESLALTNTRVGIERDNETGCWRIQGRDGVALGIAPSLNGPPDTGFRATELLLGALGLCMTDLTLSYCLQKGFPVRSVRSELTDHVSPDPLRVDSITVTLHLEGPLTEEQKERVLRVAKKYCKIKNTLALCPAVDVVLRGTPAEAGDDEGAPSINCAC